MTRAGLVYCVTEPRPCAVKVESCARMREEVSTYGLIPSRSARNRNAAAKSLSAVSARTRGQSTCSRTARARAAAAEVAVVLGQGPAAWWSITSVGDSTGMRIARTSCSSRADQVRGRPASPFTRCSTSTTTPSPRRLEQPVLGRPFDVEARVAQDRRGSVGIGFRHDQVDVMGRLGRAVHPQRVASGQREFRAVRLQGGRRTLQCVAHRGLVTCRHPRQTCDRYVVMMGIKYPMRLATFNILHGRTVRRRRRRCRPAARTACAPSTPTCWRCRRSIVDQPRSGLADLTAVAAEAMGAVSHRFVAAIAGTPGATWMAATGRRTAGHRGVRHRAAVALPGQQWQVVRLPRIPIALPDVPAGPRRVMVVDEEPRAAVIGRFDTPAGPLTVANTHLSFVPGWNRRQLRHLARDLRGLPGPQC